MPCYRGARARTVQWLSYGTDDEQRSISEVVQGLHGGKYQFAEAGVNLQGQQFAEQGYGSSGMDTAKEQQALESEDLPRWAERLRDPSLLPSAENAKELSLTRSIDDNNLITVTISIANDERSWERYYAFAVGPLADSLHIEPWVGQLAPRTNKNPKYSNTATVTVVYVGQSDSGSQDIVPGTWIVIGTEAEKWFYKLALPANS